jgi:hypothetical protein
MRYIPSSFQLFKVLFWNNDLHSLLRRYFITDFSRRLGSNNYWHLKQLLTQLFCFSGKKVKLSLCLTNYALCHEGIWGSGCIDAHFHDLGTTWRWVVSFTPQPLYPGTYWIRGWMDPRAGLDDMKKRKFLILPDSNSYPSVVQPVASCYPGFFLF